MPEDSLLTLKQVIERTTLSRTQVYVRMAEGTFPASRKLGSKKVVWSNNEVTTWINEVLKGEAA